MIAMVDALFELVMNRNPMIKTREHGLLTVNVTADGKIRIKWGEKEVVLSPEKALRFFNGCVMLAEIARRLGEDVDWSAYWNKKLSKAKKTKAKARAAKVEEEEEEAEEEEVETEEGVVEVL
ncbi:MAG: hypothetical protein DRP00_04150 [Candidatus Aenigmatarchaeota archaeon]|nr:MAG: hypothetical protein DRP00_04150 [Candidatus Aenigmarchaeota archaeon]